MALTNYGELKSAIASWLERDDLTARIPDFIALAQARMYSGDAGIQLPALRIAAMLSSGTIAITGGVGATPAGWLEFQRLRVNSSDRPNMAFLPPTRFWDNAAAHYVDTPFYYTIEGSTLRTAPAGDATLSATWYARLAAMSADGDADYVMTNAPQVYLHGALYEAYEFEGTLDRAAQHAARFASAVRAVNDQDARAQTSGSALVMRGRTVS